MYPQVLVLEAVAVMGLEVLMDVTDAQRTTIESQRKRKQWRLNR